MSWRPLPKGIATQEAEAAVAEEIYHKAQGQVFLQKHLANWERVNWTGCTCSVEAATLARESGRAKSMGKATDEWKS